MEYKPTIRPTLNGRYLLRQQAERDPKFGRQVAEWCGVSYAHAIEQLAGIGQKVTKLRLRNFMRWWEWRGSFAQVEAETTAYEKQLEKDFPAATTEEVRISAQEFFEQLAMERANVKEYCELQYLRMAKLTEERKAKLEEKKMRLETRKIAALEKKNGKKEKRKQGGGLSAKALLEIEEAAKLL